MTHYRTLLGAALAALTFAGAAQAADPAKKEIVFGATAGPYSDQIKLGIKPILEKQGYTVKIVEFNDYVQPNFALAQGALDANAFQHVVYLKNFAAKNKLELSELVKVPTAPIAIYSKKYKSVDAAPDGVSVAVPNDPTNQARALVVLQELGWVKLREGYDPLQVSEKDVAVNVKKIKLIPLEAAQLPRSLDDTDYSFVNGNFALASGLKLNEALALWGDDVEVMYAMHHWPVWGKKEVQEQLSLQRDMYRYINDETLRLANMGYNKEEIAEQVKLPEAIATKFSNRGYYGSLNHNVRATYVLYLGWFNGNPATLHTLPIQEASKRYVDMMGGVPAILEKAREYYKKGDYRWVAEVVNYAVFADPNNQEAKNLQADALEQMGYQAESGPWRNFYLTGAKELREGVQKLPVPDTASPDTVRAMTLDMLFDYFAVRLNREKSAGKHVVLNLDFTDTNQKYTLEMVNSVLNHTEGKQAKQPTASMTLSRDTLNRMMLKETTLKDALAKGDVKVSGDQEKITDMFAALDNFEFWFNIVTP